MLYNTPQVGMISCCSPIKASRSENRLNGLTRSCQETLLLLIGTLVIPQPKNFLFLFFVAFAGLLNGRDLRLVAVVNRL